MDGLQVGPIRIKRYLVRLYLSALGIFALNKLFVRRWVLRSDAPAFVDTIVLSLPNAVEAMVGMTGIAVLLFLARERFRARMQATPDGIIYIVTALATTAFVVSQELNLHRLGGDPGLRSSGRGRIHGGGPAHALPVRPQGCLRSRAAGAPATVDFKPVR